MKRINAALDRAGLKITSGVGTMWCAILFLCIALVSLPGALATGSLVIIVAWVAQTFLQLVLLSIIMVGQRLQGVETERRDIETHDRLIGYLDSLHAETERKAADRHLETHAKLDAHTAALNKEIAP